MIQSVLEDGTYIMADDVQYKGDGPFLCPYCKTEMTLVVPGLLSNINKHFKHHHHAPLNCIGRRPGPEKPLSAIDLRGRASAYVYCPNYDPSDLRSINDALYKIMVFDEDRNTIYKSLEYPNDDYLKLFNSNKDVFCEILHKISFMNTLKICTVQPHSSIEIITTLYGHIPKPAIQEIDDTISEAYNFLHQPKIHRVIKDDNISFFESDEVEIVNPFYVKGVRGSFEKCLKVFCYGDIISDGVICCKVIVFDQHDNAVMIECSVIDHGEVLDYRTSQLLSMVYAAELIRDRFYKRNTVMFSSSDSFTYKLIESIATGRLGSMNFKYSDEAIELFSDTNVVKKGVHRIVYNPAYHLQKGDYSIYFHLDGFCDLKGQLPKELEEIYFDKTKTTKPA